MVMTDRDRQKALVVRALNCFGGKQAELARRMTDARADPSLPAIDQSSVSKLKSASTMVTLPTAVLIDLSTDGKVEAREFFPILGELIDRDIARSRKRGPRKRPEKPLRARAVAAVEARA